MADSNNRCSIPASRTSATMALPVLLAMLVAVVGCGGNPASVSGVVTLDGQPLDHGTIGFTPIGGGMRAAASIDADGSYTLKTNREAGLDIGEYKVTVLSREAGEAPKHGGPPMPGAYITPRHYALASTSGLQFNVEAGSNEIDIPLSSEKRQVQATR